MCFYSSLHLFYKEKQRDEQRRLKAEKKERERQEDNGYWADRYQTDRHKLSQYAGTSSQGPAAFIEKPKTYELPEAQRTSSAPEHPVTVRDSQDEA